MRIPQAPLFSDPIYNGAADPVIFYNHEEAEWWIVYTQRMHSAPGPGHAPIHGSKLGVAASPDGRDWLYRGTLEGLEFERGHNTFWAPEIIRHEGKYHMYVSYVRGIPTTWERPRDIIHYTSANGWDWTFEKKLRLSSERVIDACVAKLPSGVWRMWYKDENHKSHSYFADSRDLYEWEAGGAAITLDAHEGPNVFEFAGSFWLIADFWR
ncbi:MAG: family 43 glycosylhydrolase, partial [Clostridiales bacterium]|nr:family 43 glycosylhydrolase [Clostridiales bacterium]